MKQDIKQCVLTAIKDDSGAYPLAQAEYNGKEIDVLVITPYGVASIPPIRSHGVMFRIQGRGDTQFAIFNDYPNRFKDLKESEVQTGNYKTGTSIKHNEAGDIVIDAPKENIVIKAAKKVTIDATEVTIISPVVINGGLQVNGESVSSGRMTASDFESSGSGIGFNSHTHPESSGGNTGQPS